MDDGEVLTVVVREVPGFRHSQLTGAFRKWLRTVVDLAETGEVRDREASIGSLLRVIEQLQGTPLPASALERQILAARLPGYQPALLDQLGASGEIVWAGAGAIGSDDGWVVLALADQAPLLLPEVADGGLVLRWLRNSPADVGVLPYGAEEAVARELWTVCPGISVGLLARAGYTPFGPPVTDSSRAQGGLICVAVAVLAVALLAQPRPVPAVGRPPRDGVVFGLQRQPADHRVRRPADRGRACAVGSHGQGPRDDPGGAAAPDNGRIAGVAPDAKIMPFAWGDWA